MRSEQSVTVRLTGVQLVTMDKDNRVFPGEIEFSGGQITAVGKDLPAPGADTVVRDCSGMVCLPGFVQGHVHLCQTLFRGLAEGRTLDQWLIGRIWPLEAAHDPASIAASARLGIAEALLHGATSLLDMGTVYHTEKTAEICEEMGIRAIVGKALMDAGSEIPDGLMQNRDAAFDEALSLYHDWHGKAGGRIQVSFAPRFTLSVSAPLWRRIGEAAAADDILVHTHACETPWENETCQKMHGRRPIAALADWGVLEARCVMAHGIWLDDGDRRLMGEHGASIVSCPGSNAKLGSGVIALAPLRDKAIPVGLGSDGAACNDLFSMTAEMRLCAQLQNLQFGPGTISQELPLEMATRLGAEAIGLNQTGQLAEGKAADLILFKTDDFDWPADMPMTHTLTFGGGGVRPRDVFVAGKQLVAEGRLVDYDMNEIKDDANRQRKALLSRAKLGDE
jgi:5-methylthioadenosine/S-adenosylhomocysteine deaminase